MTNVPRKARVLLVDDHPIYRDGLKALVDSHPSLRVVGETDNAGGALALLELVLPDLVITDLRLARGSGHELIEAALKVRPDLKIVVISIDDQNSEVLRAVQTVAYLTKGATRDEAEDSPSGNTPREREIIDMLLQGRSSSEIGETLFLSASTVKTHLRNLYRKHEVSSRSQLILKMIKERVE